MSLVCKSLVGIAAAVALATEPGIAAEQPVHSIWARHPRFHTDPYDVEDEVIAFREGNTFTYHRAGFAASGSYELDLVDGKGLITLTGLARQGEVTQLNEDTFRVIWSTGLPQDPERGKRASDLKLAGLFGDQKIFIYHKARAVDYQEFKALRADRQANALSWISTQTRLGQRAVLLPGPDEDDGTAALDRLDPLVEIVATRGEGPFALERDDADQRAFRTRLMADGSENLSGPRPLTALSRDGFTLACTTGRGLIRVWDLDRGERLLTLRTRPLPGMTMSADGKRLLAIHGHQAALIDMEALRIEATLEGAPLQFGAFSPDGRLLALILLDQQTPFARLWDARTLKPVQELRGMGKDLTTVCFSADGSLFATGNQ